jgi:hypothetical protein
MINQAVEQGQMHCWDGMQSTLLTGHVLEKKINK